MPGFADVETALDQRALAAAQLPGRRDARRRRRGQPRRPHLGRAAAVRLHAAAPLGAGRRARHPRSARPAPRSPARGSRSCAARARGWSARSPSFMLDLHTREHGYEEVAPPYLVNRATPDRHRPAAQVRGRPVRHPGGRPVPHSHRRGAGHQHPPGRDSRGGRPAARLLSRARRASAARPAPTARTRAGSSGCTSSTRSSWSASAVPTTRPRSTSG